MSVNVLFEIVNVYYKVELICVFVYIGLCKIVEEVDFVMLGCVYWYNN